MLINQVKILYKYAINYKLIHESCKKLQMVALPISVEKPSLYPAHWGKNHWKQDRSWNKEVFLYLRLNISIMIILEKKCCWFGVIFSGSNMQCRQSHFPLSVILQKNSHCLIVSLLQCNCEWSESILLEWKEKRCCIKLVWSRQEFGRKRLKLHSVE